MDDDRSRLSRRRFLSGSAAAMVTAGLAGVPLREALADDTTKQAKEKPGEIIYRTLGKTGIKMPIVGMGVMNADNPGVVQASYELGVRHFDTAAYYQSGRNEEMVGRVIKKLGVRDKVIIGTKIFTPDMYGDLEPDATKKTILAQFDGCLKRLQMDYVDILYLHNVKDPAILTHPAVQKTFAAIKKQGKARFIGLTTHTRMAEPIKAALQTNLWEVILTAVNFTLVDYTDLYAAMAQAAEKGVGLIAMKTQAGGPNLPDQDSAEKYSSATMTTAALKWALHLEHITTAIPGYTNYEHMRQDFSVASDFAYTKEESQFLTDNKVKLGYGFCRQCYSCLASCPRGVEVPGLMRTWMYTRQYANFHQARATYDEIPRSKSLAACSDCSECTARCVHTVDIPRRVEELKLVYA
ncbi:MAG: aldo/keto reductase [bacterium]